MSAIYRARIDPKFAAMAPENLLNPVYVAAPLRREDQALLNYANIWIDDPKSFRCDPIDANRQCR